MCHGQKCSMKMKMFLKKSKKVYLFDFFKNISCAQKVKIFLQKFVQLTVASLGGYPLGNVANLLNLNNPKAKVT